MILTPITQHAQISGSTTCIDAPVFCSLSDLNGYKSKMSDLDVYDFPFTTLCSGIGTPDNMLWWTFIGTGEPITITFQVDQFSCEKFFGMQAGVFDGDCTGNSIWDCTGECDRYFFSLSGNTKKLSTYYLWIDGCNEDICDFTISVSDTTTQQRLPPLEQLSTIDKVCPCNEFDVCPSGLGDCQPIIEWSVDGKSKGRSNCISVSVPKTAPAGSKITVCMTAIVGNPNNKNGICHQDQVCTDFIVEAVEETVEPCKVVCFEDQPFTWQGLPITSSCIAPPCSQRVQGPDGCCTDISQVIILLERPRPGSKDTFICDFNTPYIAEDGRNYSSDQCGEQIEFSSPSKYSNCLRYSPMCDTFYFLNLRYFSYRSKPEISCSPCSGEISVKANVEYDPECPEFKDQVSISLEWFDNLTGDRIGNTNGSGTIIRTSPGRICAVISGVYLDQICTSPNELCIDVKKQDFPSPPQISGDFTICENPFATYYTEQNSSRCEYAWSVEGGGLITGSNTLDSSTITVDWSNRNGSTGIICLELKTDCGITDSCIIVHFDTINQPPTDTLFLCINESIQINEPLPLSNRQWSNGDTSTSITIFNEGEICITGDPIDSSCTINKCYFIKKSDLILTDTFIENEWAPFKGEIRPVIQTNDSIIDIQWSNGDTTLNIDSLEADIYTLVITTKANCTYTFVFEIERTTSNKNVQSTHFTIEPNPSRDLFLHPVTDLSLVNTISVFSASGYSFKVNNAPSSLSDLSTIPPGVYWIKLDLIDGNYQVLKWVKHE